jgi:hypothetical protein
MTANISLSDSHLRLCGLVGKSRSVYLLYYPHLLLPDQGPQLSVRILLVSNQKSDPIKKTNNGGAAEGTAPRLRPFR